MKSNQMRKDQGVTMKYSVRWLAILIVSTVAAAYATQVQSQESMPYTANPTAPPEKYAISPGGVDIRTGRYAYDRTDLSIGDFAFKRILSTAIGGGHVDPFGNFSHNWEITLVEKRIDMETGKYKHGTGNDFRMTVNFDGRSETFQGSQYYAESPQISKSPYAKLTSVGDRNSADVIYTFTASGGTRVIFRPLGGQDCMTVMRCAYPSQIIHADGTTYDFEYETTWPLTSSRLRSVVSNRGYALMLEYAGSGPSWKLVSKACVLNLAYYAKPADNICPAYAQATTSYTYTSFAGQMRLASATDALGNASTYGYSSVGGTSPFYFGGPMYSMSFTKPGQSSAWQTLTIAPTPNNDGEYDQAVIQQTFADGSGYSYQYDLSPQVDDEYSTVMGGTFFDALGHSTSVSYGYFRLPPTLNPPKFHSEENIDDANYQVTPGPVDVIDPLGRTMHMDYCDPNMMASLPAWVVDRCVVLNLQSSTDPSGVKTVYTYSVGHLIQSRQVAKAGSGLSDIVVTGGDNCSGNLVLCGKPPTVTDARGAVTNFTYDATHGGVLTVTLPAPTSGAVRPQKRYTYSQLYAWYKDSSGSLAQASSPIWVLTSISECRTQSSCIGTADETRTTISYGSPGTPNNLLPVSQTISAGDGSISATTAKTYDLQGNVLTVDGPLSGPSDTTRTIYDKLGRVVGTISADPDGGGPLLYRAVRNTYDTAGNLIRVEKGTVIGQSDSDWATFSALQAVDTAYDLLGRKTRDLAWAGSTAYSLTHYKYDLAGRLECTAVRMDPAQWSAQTDACIPQISGPNGPDRISRIVYDAAGQILIKKIAVGTVDEADDETYTYTASGKPETVKDGENNLTTFEYDGFDRLAKTRYPVASAGAQVSSTTDFEQLAYDANGNVTQRRLRDGNVINSTFDALNRPTIKDLPTPELDVGYSYDLQGHLETSSQGSAYVTDAYDALGRVVSETTDQSVMSYQYDSAGRRTRTTWSDGFFVTQDFLATGEVNVIRENGATSGVGVLATYAYDNLGRRTSITRGNGTVSSFGYDAVSRLESLSQNLAGTTQDVSSVFSYNPASQITSWIRDNDAYIWKEHPNQNKSYGVNGLNQLTSAGAVSIGYDGRGNLTNQGSSVYSYTVENRLVSGPNGAAFIYDPVGRLSQSTGSSGVTRFQYDGTDLVAEYNASNSLVRRYVHGPGADEPLVWYEGAGTSDRRWFHQDERGSIVALTNSSGATLNINTYDEYGIPASTNQGRFQYTGQTWMPEIGLYYYKARVYSPTLGRFLQTDPIGYGDGINWYAYVHDDPVNGVDASGLGCGSNMDNVNTANCKSYDLSDSQSPSGDDNPKPVRGRRAESQRLAALGKAFYDALPGVYQAEQSQLSWSRGEYGLSILQYGAAIADAAVSILTLGEYSAASSAARAAGNAAKGAETIFKTTHYASRLEKAGVGVARAEAEVAKAVGAMRPNMVESAAVSARLTIDGVLVEYRAMMLPNGTVNIGTIFPVVP